MKVAGKPWSLVRRLTGGVVLVSLLGFVAQVVLMGVWLRPVATDISVATAEQARQVRVALDSVPAAARDALAQRLSSPTLQVTRNAPPRAAESLLAAPPEMDKQRRLLAAEGITMRVESRADTGVAIVYGLPVDGQTWWMVRTVGGPGAAVFSTLAVWLVLLGSATLGALWFSVRQIARPLRRLAENIGQQRGVLAPLPERPGSSAEIQVLVQAFNALARQAAEAAEVRQQLLAGVSHDLRTPLARLRLRVETQCEPEVADELTADLLALERIVDQFLAYVQGDHGVLRGKPEPLADTVHAVALRYAGMRQVLDLHIEPVRMALPDLAVHRLLTNLVDNAWAYGRGPVRVEVRARSDGVALAVYDHGPGMTAAEFEQACKPFVRLTAARSALGHCGLGLSIVSQIARQLGAQLGLVRAADGAFGIQLVVPHG